MLHLYQVGEQLVLAIGKLLKDVKRRSSEINLFLHGFSFDDRMTICNQHLRTLNFWYIHSPVLPLKKNDDRHL